MPLLWYLRDQLQLTGTKFGCGIGICGACTVLLNGAAQRSCRTPVKVVGKREVTTIEGLAGTKLHPVQRAWIEEDVPQCGYCQGGQILAAVDLLRRNPDPDDSQINSISNLCRCDMGTALGEHVQILSPSGCRPEQDVGAGVVHR